MNILDSLFGGQKMDKPTPSNIKINVIGQPSETQSKPVVKLIASPKNEEVIGQKPKKKPEPMFSARDVGLKNHMKQYEGEIPYLYLDTAGFPTFGVGSRYKFYRQDLIDMGYDAKALDAQVEKLKRLRAEGKLPAEARDYPEELRFPIKEEDYTKTFLKGMSTAKKAVADYMEMNTDDLPDTVFNVLSSMAYQLGRGGLFKFRKTKTKLLKALEDPSYYPLVADEMLLSDWYLAPKNEGGTPERAYDHSELIRGMFVQ